MGNYNFKRDLETAKVTEEEYAAILASKYAIEIREVGNTTYEYDIKAFDGVKELLFEIKEDFMSGDTGNVAVEFSCRGKPSGIETTKSDFYVYKIHRPGKIVYLLINVKKLRRAIEDHLYFRVVNGGDAGSNTLCYLFKYNKFLELGSITNIVEL